jgi:hypothetical protein
MAVKVYTNLDAGAPTLTGQVGVMLTVLDAVLVNGYNSVSITSITRSSNVATATFASAHGLATGDTALIAGANEVDYNGEFVVTVTSTTTLTFAVANTPATPATGTITGKRAGGGFAKPFTGTNIAVYRSNDVTGIRHYLQVKDDGTGAGGNREALLRGYETMSSATVGTGPFPIVSQSTNGYIMGKSSTTDATARPWTIITDGFIFYMWVQYAGTAANGVTLPITTNTCLFGDIKSYKTGDVYSSTVGGATTENNTTSFSGGLGTGVLSVPTTSTFGTPTGLACPRDFTGTGSAKLQSLFGTGQNTIISSTLQVQYPNPVDGGMYIAPIAVVQGLPSAIRGSLPGVYESLHGVNTHLGGDIITNVTGLPGRKLRWMPATSSSSQAGAFIDVTGPWR